jgi:hypothetical protein
MADAYKKLYQGQPGVAAATLATVPGSTTWIIRHIRAVNTDAALPVTLELWHDGTADENKILGAVSIPVDNTYTEDCFICAEAGDTIAGKAGEADEVTVTLYGVEIT